MAVFTPAGADYAMAYWNKLSPNFRCPHEDILKRGSTRYWPNGFPSRSRGYRSICCPRSHSHIRLYRRSESERQIPRQPYQIATQRLNTLGITQPQAVANTVLILKQTNLFHRRENVTGRMASVIWFNAVEVLRQYPIHFFNNDLNSSTSANKH